jgi:hypothetical protein
MRLTALHVWDPNLSCPFPVSGSLIFMSRVGILKQNAKSWYSGIPGFEVRRNSKLYYFVELFFKHWFIAALYTLYTVPEQLRC